MYYLHGLFSVCLSDIAQHNYLQRQYVTHPWRLLVLWDGALYYRVSVTFPCEYSCWDTCSSIRFRGYICFPLPKFSRADIFSQNDAFWIFWKNSVKSMTVYLVDISNQFPIKELLIDTVHYVFQLKTKCVPTKIYYSFNLWTGKWLQCNFGPMNHKNHNRPQRAMVKHNPYWIQ